MATAAAAAVATVATETGELPASVQKEVNILQALQHKLGDIETLAHPLCEAAGIENVEKQLSSLEAAKLEVAMAYSLANLYFVQLNIAGKDVSGHPLHEVLKRIKEYMALIIAKESAAQQHSEAPPSEKRKIVDEHDQSRGEEVEEEDNSKQKKRKIKVNKAGAERMIRHYVS